MSRFIGFSRQTARQTERVSLNHCSITFFLKMEHVLSFHSRANFPRCKLYTSWVFFHITRNLYKKNIPEFFTNDVFTLQQGGKMGSKNGRQKCNLFSNIASKRVSQVCFAFYHTRIKPVLHQIRLLHVAKSCCRKLRVVILFATNCVHVARFTGLRQTGFAISDVTPVHGATPA